MKQKSGSDGIKKNMRQIRENLSNKTWSLVSNSSLSKILGLKIIFGKKKTWVQKALWDQRNFGSERNFRSEKKF